jgi:hypothetical protein
LVVYAVAGEQPTRQTAAAAVLIVAVLASHTAWDVHVKSRQQHKPLAKDSSSDLAGVELLAEDTLANESQPA